MFRGELEDRVRGVPLCAWGGNWGDLRAAWSWSGQCQERGNEEEQEGYLWSQRSGHSEFRSATMSWLKGRAGWEWEETLRRMERGRRLQWNQSSTKKCIFRIQPIHICLRTKAKTHKTCFCCNFSTPVKQDWECIFCSINIPLSSLLSRKQYGTMKYSSWLHKACMFGC